MVDLANLQVARMKLGTCVSLCQIMSERPSRRSTQFRNTSLLPRTARKAMRITEEDLWNLLLVTTFFLKSFHIREEYGLERGES